LPAFSLENKREAEWIGWNRPLSCAVGSRRAPKTTGHSGSLTAEGHLVVVAPWAVGVREAPGATGRPRRRHLGRLALDSRDRSRRSGGSTATTAPSRPLRQQAAPSPGASGSTNHSSTNGRSIHARHILISWSDLSRSRIRLAFARLWVAAEGPCVAQGAVAGSGYRELFAGLDRLQQLDQASNASGVGTGVTDQSCANTRAWASGTSGSATKPSPGRPVTSLTTRLVRADRWFKKQ
jgi:hypothetical protein